MKFLDWFSSKPALGVTHNFDDLSAPVEIRYRKVKLWITVDQAYEAHEKLTQVIKGLGGHDRMRLQQHGANKVVAKIGGVKVQIPITGSIDFAEQLKRSADTVLQLTHWSGHHREFARQPEGGNENKQQP